MSSSIPSAPRRLDGAASSSARERLVRTAYDLFCRHGVPAIGVDRIVAEAGVAKSTLYRHFRSKDELVVAVLELRERLWTKGWLGDELERVGGAPEARLLAVFDLYEAWFRSDGYEGCLFINSLLESHDAEGVVGTASVKGLTGVRSLLRRIAEEAGVRDPGRFADQWQILLAGAIVAACEGNRETVEQTREVASLFLDRAVS